MNPVMYLLVGLPRTGKSTWTKNKIEQNPETLYVLSRDIIRRDVFGKIYDYEIEEDVTRVSDAILKGLVNHKRDIIVDNTNLYYKTRKQYYEMAEAHGYDIVIVRTFAEINGMMERADKKPIPRSIMDNMLIGNDSSMIECYDVLKHPNINITVEDVALDRINLVDDIYVKMAGFEQDNPHHTETLFCHSQSVVGMLPKSMRRMGMRHDIGKLFTKKFDPAKGYSRYFGHANVSAYVVEHAYIDKKEEKDAQYYMELFAIYTHMIRFGGFGKSFFDRVLVLSTMEGVTVEKIFETMTTLWYADVMSHGKEDDEQIRELMFVQEDMRRGYDDFIRLNQKVQKERRFDSIF